MYKAITGESRKGSDRSNYVEILLKNSENVKLGKGKSLGFVGGLNIGKTFIVKEFLSSCSNAAYVDFTKVGLTPEEFATRMILSICSWHLKRDVTSLDDCKIGSSSGAIVELVKNEFLKIKPDHVKLIRLGLEYSEAVCKDFGISKVICLDEFWKILDFNNFQAVSDVLLLFKEIISSLKFVKFVLIGSAVTLMKEICSTLRVEVVEVSGVTVDDDLQYYSQGVPLFVDVLQERVSSGYGLSEAFVVETLWKRGRIYNACNLKLDDSLDRARGKGLLISILTALSKDELRLSEISRAIYRSAGVTKNLVDRLVKVDLVVRENGKYRFEDSILKYWFREIYSGREYETMPRKQDLRNKEVDL
jgi:uncharacterized protein